MARNGCKLAAGKITNLSVGLLMFTAWSFSQAGEPTILVKKQQVYQEGLRKIEAERDAKFNSLTKRYMRSLQETQIHYTKKGDLDGAIAVKAEIEAVRKTLLNSDDPPPAAQAKDDPAQVIPPALNANKVLLTDLKMVKAISGWDQVRVNEMPNDAGSIKMKKYNNYIWTHADSEVEYQVLNGMRYLATHFTTSYTVTDMIFAIEADGNELWRSKPLDQYKKGYGSVMVELPGEAKTVTLKSFGYSDGAWSTWVDPVFLAIPSLKERRHYDKSK